MPQGVCRSATFCLHARPYRESSAILQLFSREFGRFSAVQRGARSPARTRRSPSVQAQPFATLYAEWYGPRELKTLSRLEAESPPILLSGTALFAGLYLNELLTLALPEQQEHPFLYDAYEQTLRRLAAGNSLEVPLRSFERCLLEELGYGIPFHAVDVDGHHCGEIVPGLRYVYVPESGFLPAVGGDRRIDAEGFEGELLLKVAAGELDCPDTQRAAKQLMRRALAPLLGHKALNSRHLFA